jgi:two-component system, chemotaxis family, protein-glutamate methylesterase/glutaminase
MAQRDIVVIGASMGGIEALKRLVARFPAGLPAAVFVVQHTSAESPGYLADILDKAGPLSAGLAIDLEHIHPGRIYVAPPDCHLLVKEKCIVVAHGPRENRMRPAIDPLFRSAAVAHRTRVIGIILTGLLDDGASGLDAVKRCGGVAVVQAPDDAAYPDMPRRALEVADVDYVIPLDEIADLVQRLVLEEAPEAQDVPKDLQLEAMIAEQSMNSLNGEDALGKPSTYTCPECGGSLWEMDDDALRRYRCRTGHAYTARVLLADQDHQVEQALWAALRMMEERSNMLARMAREEKAQGRDRAAAVYEERIAESRGHAEGIRNLLLRTAGGKENGSVYLQS